MGKKLQLIFVPTEKTAHFFTLNVLWQVTQ